MDHNIVNSKHVKHAGMFVTSLLIMIFAFNQFKNIYAIHGFIITRTLAFTENTEHLKIGFFHEVLSRPISGDLKHSDILCVALFLLLLISFLVCVDSFVKLRYEDKQ